MDTVDRYNDLSTKVVAQVGKPQGLLVVYATLESFGIRNQDTKQDYGFDSLQELAAAIYNQIVAMPREDVKNTAEKKEQRTQAYLPVNDYSKVKLNWFAKYYGIGLFYLLPIFIQVFAIIYFNYSLWTYLKFNIVQSTAVVLGVIFGFVISGGFVQLMGRQAFFYWEHKKYAKTRHLIYSYTQSGIKLFLGGVLFLFLTNFLLHLFPISFMLVLCGYTFMLATLLLTIAPFYPLKKRWAVTITITLATIIALVLHEIFKVHVYVSHFLGLAAAITFNLAFIWYFFKQKIGVDKREYERPSKIKVFYNNYPYFFYGMLLYVFVFMDRIIAWSANWTNSFKFPLLYEKNYEIGMDLAILMFFALVGVGEYAIAEFSKKLDQNQKGLAFTDRRIFGNHFKNLYRSHILILWITAIISSVVIYLLVTEPWGYIAKFGEELATTSMHVSIAGSIGYIFLSWGMLNVLYMFTLNVVRPSLRALAIATLVNFSVGFVLSRTFTHDLSVYGMLLGAIVFTVLTHKHLHNFFNRLDFHYSAAY